MQDGVDITSTEDGTLDVTGLTPQEVGDRAFDAGIRVHELTLRQASLEQAYMDLTAHAVEYHGGTTTAASAATTSRAA